MELWSQSNFKPKNLSFLLIQNERKTPIIAYLLPVQVLRKSNRN